MTDKTITLLQLYPRDMNIYGDWGNTLVLKRRLEWHGYNVDLKSYDPGDKFPDNIDMIVGGGGQDSGQDKIQTDLLKISDRLHSLADNGVPMLMICGMYQLFGKFFKTRDGHIIEGISIFNLETYGGEERMIGNIVTESEDFGKIIGYENHSGQTVLGGDVRPLGKVLKGAGNNGRDETEGARYKNVIGTYMHGSLLPKNPNIADWMIEQSIKRKFGDCELSVIEDRFAEMARDAALRRPR